MQGPPLFPIPIKPKNIRIIFFDQLADLIFHILEILRFALASREFGSLGGIFPINNGVVGAEADSILLAGRAQFRQGIEIEPGQILDVIVSIGTVPQTESVMMLGGDHEILHPGIAGAAHPGIRIKLVGLELFAHLAIIGL